MIANEKMTEEGAINCNVKLSIFILPSTSIPCFNRSDPDVKNLPAKYTPESLNERNQVIPHSVFQAMYHMINK